MRFSRTTCRRRPRSVVSNARARLPRNLIPCQIPPDMRDFYSRSAFSSNWILVLLRHLTHTFDKVATRGDEEPKAGSRYSSGCPPIEQTIEWARGRRLWGDQRTKGTGVSRNGDTDSVWNGPANGSSNLAQKRGQEADCPSAAARPESGGDNSTKSVGSRHKSTDELSRRFLDQKATEGQERRKEVGRMRNGAVPSRLVRRSIPPGSS